MNETSPTVAAELGYRSLNLDDNVGSAKILGTLFRKLGQNQVDLAHCGREAIDKARQHHPDVIILDLLLGDMSGWEVAQTTHQEAELSGTRLLAARTGKSATASGQTYGGPTRQGNHHPSPRVPT